jgi:L-ribulose-5-phosphate 3-epimerase
VKPLLKAVKLGMYANESSLAQRFDDLVSVGLDGVEIGVDDTTSPDSILAASGASGLQVPTLIAGGTFTNSLASADQHERRRAAESVLRAIDVAQIVGAGVVMVSPGWDRAELHPDATAAVVRDELGPTVAAAEAAGVTIAIENLWNGWLTSAADLARFVDSYESDHVGVLFDSGNAARFSPPQHWVEILGRRVVRLDVKDYKNGWARKPASVYADDEALQASWGEGGPWGALDALPFQGDVDWPLLTGAIRRSGYDGWCCAEHGAGDLAWIAGFVAILDEFSALCSSGGKDT